MGISTRCCLNVSPPTPNPGFDNSSPLNTKGSQLSWPRDDDKWRKQCVLGMAAACMMMIGSQVVGDINNNNNNVAIATEIPPPVVAVESKASRWSDRRMCPPWQVNSLETIVPENLPRPSAHRRWEAIGFSDNAPATKVIVARKARTGCFTM